MVKPIMLPNAFIGKPGQPTGYPRKVKGVRLSGGYYFGPAKRRR